MGVVVVGVDCVSSGSGRCFAPELVQVAEESVVPLTWFLSVSSRDPMGTISLYHNEFLHRIPAWHEIGVRLDTRNGHDPNDAQSRRDLVRLGKEMLKQCHVKPVSAHLDGSPLLASDITHLEDVGMIVVVADVPGRQEVEPVPYHPAYDDPSKNGTARLFVVTNAMFDLSGGWETLQARLSERLQAPGLVLLMTRDDRDDTANLRRALALVAPGRTSTLTAAATG